MDEMREGLPGPAKKPWYESLNLEEIDNIITTKMKETADIQTVRRSWWNF